MSPGSGEAVWLVPSDLVGSPRPTVTGIWEADWLVPSVTGIWDADWLVPSVTGIWDADWLVPSELDLQDLCAEAAESKELEELWSSTYIFITLFLLSVSYGATVTLLKVGSCTSVGGAREG
ncbi:hypothetical protein LEMLEM_LOCUS4551 [Lemmus lemmus]